MDSNQLPDQEAAPLEQHLPLMGLQPPQKAILEAHMTDASYKLIHIQFTGSVDDINNQLRAHAYHRGRLDAFKDIYKYDQNRMKEIAEKAQAQQAQQQAANSN